MTVETAILDRVDLDQASAFLGLLDGCKQHTFQTFDDDKNRKDRRLARTLYGALDLHRRELERLNRRGAGIFVSINAIIPGCERRIENLDRIRAVWQDDDNGWEGRFPIPPSIVVRSSLGEISKFQRLWLATGSHQKSTS
jgi:hypothetical protein